MVSPSLQYSLKLGGADGIWIRVFSLKIKRTGPYEGIHNLP